MMPSQINIPYFICRTPSAGSKFIGSIEMEGKVIHSTNDLSELYKSCGYSVDLAKEGLLPDEYIWETYFKHNNGNCICCYQLHLIEFLLKHSGTFFVKYRDQCEVWIAAHAQTRAACVEKACVVRARNSSQKILHFGKPDTWDDLIAA